MPVGRPLAFSFGPFTSGQKEGAYYGSMFGFKLATGVYTPALFGSRPCRACVSKLRPRC